MRTRFMYLIGCFLGFSILCLILKTNLGTFLTGISALFCGYTIGKMDDAVHAVSETGGKDGKS